MILSFVICFYVAESELCKKDGEACMGEDDYTCCDGGSCVKDDELGGPYYCHVDSYYSLSFSLEFDWDDDVSQY